MVTGTQIANEILDMYKNFCKVRDYPNNWLLRLDKKLTSKTYRGAFMMLSTC